MNTTIRNTALASILFAAVSGAAVAGQSADLKVTGKIAPSACDIAISGGGTIDFGTIAASTLSDTAATVVGDKETSFTMTCSAATKVMWTSGDNRAGTADATAGSSIYRDFNAYFGVGAIDGKNIGAYVIHMPKPAVADGQDVGATVSSDNGNTWTGFKTVGIAANNHSQQAFSWAPSGTDSPAAYKTVTQPFSVKLAIGKTSELPPLTQEVAIDGSATITLKYL